MNEIIALLCPDVEPAERGLLWAKFQVNRIPGCQWVYYCTDAEIAAELLVNQIKPFIHSGEGYFCVFPNTDMVDIMGDSTPLQTSFTIVHFGWYSSYLSEAIARTHVSQLLALYRESQNQYISAVRINNTNFSKWSDDNSVLEQYTANITVTAVTPYVLAPEC